MKGTPIQVTFGSVDDINECIETKWKELTTRSLIFLLEDPERPLVPVNSVNWYCRGTIECSAIDYMIMFDFYVYFPTSFSISKIMKLLKDPAFAGVRPQLDYQESMDGIGTYSVEFHRGSGAYGNAISPSLVGEHLYREVENNLDVIYALNDFEMDYKNTKLFNKLHRALIKAYQSY